MNSVDDCSLIHGEELDKRAGKKNPYTYWREREIDIRAND